MLLHGPTSSQAVGLASGLLGAEEPIAQRRPQGLPRGKLSGIGQRTVVRIGL